MENSNSEATSMNFQHTQMVFISIEHCMQQPFHCASWYPCYGISGLQTSLKLAQDVSTAFVQLSIRAAQHSFSIVFQQKIYSLPLCRFSVLTSNWNRRVGSIYLCTTTVYRRDLECINVRPIALHKEMIKILSSLAIIWDCDHFCRYWHLTDILQMTLSNDTNTAHRWTAQHQKGWSKKGI